MSYRVIDLIGTTQGLANYAWGINDQHPGIEAQPWPPNPQQPQPLPVGQVVGSIETIHGLRAFRWDEAGGVTNLGGQSPGVHTRAYAINDAGTAAGWWHASGVADQAVIWGENLDVTALAPLLSAVISNAYDINDKGVVVGRARPASPAPFRGFVYDSIGADVVWISAPNPLAHCFPQAINRHGVVVGQFGFDANLSTPLSAGANRPFVWSAADGLMPLLEKGTGSANDVNDAGVIVGMHFEKDENQVSLPRGAFIRRPDGTVFYPADGFGVRGEGFSANAVNNHTEVVGGGIRPQPGDDFYRYAWIFDRRLYGGSNPGQRTGTYEDLNSLIAPNSGWLLLSAYDINNAGQIVGHGLLNGQPKPFLLVPQVYQDNPFDIVATLAGRVLGGVAKDGGGFVIKPGGGGGPVPPWDPLGTLLSARTRGDAALVALRAAMELTDDPALRRALREILDKAGSSEP